MKILWGLLFSISIVPLNLSVFATETETTSPTESGQSEEATVAKSKWHDQIKSKFDLSDEDMKKLENSGLNHSQQSKAAQISKSSNKPIDEILDMRTNQKMGWGKIAKELGVHPSKLGKSNKDLEKSMEKRSARKAQRIKEISERKKYKKELRQERKAERRSDRFEKKGNRRKHQ